MRVVVVEDEELIAERIVRLSKELLGTRLVSISTKIALEEALVHLDKHSIDLLLLDLNLNGKDGFELLKQAVSASYHTIIISANTDKAIKAFEYGVLDFIGKPFSIERLQQAFDRYENVDQQVIRSTRYLSVRKKDELVLLGVEDINYIRGSGIYTEIHLQNGSCTLHDKSLTRLERILPSYFSRIHKSYIVNLRRVVRFRHHGDHKYDAILSNDEILPVSRARYKEIKHNIT